MAMNKPDNISLNDWRHLERKYKNLEQVVQKINQGYPIQYLIGDVDFYGHQILVNENVLIPRFETETLVDKTIKYIDKLGLDKASVLEIGTGSGCISIALKRNQPSLEITAIDISRKALTLAKKNARINKTKINFIQKNLFKFNLVNNYDVLISNPPYLIKGEVVDGKTNYEPNIALYADKTGLNFYIEIFGIAKEVLNKKFLIALEIDEDRAAEVKKQALKNFPKSKIKIEKDLNQKNRYVFVYSE